MPKLDKLNSNRLIFEKTPNLNDKKTVSVLQAAREKQALVIFYFYKLCLHIDTRESSLITLHRGKNKEVKSYLFSVFFYLPPRVDVCYVYFLQFY